MSTLRQIRSTPNILTIARLFLLPFIVIQVLDGHWRLAFALLWVAGVSDALDGILARALHQRTTLGQYLDPIADKLLLSTMFVVLALVGAVPRYVTVLVFSRDLGILLISTLLFATGTLRDFRPSLLGKANTVLQILAVLAVMTCQVVPPAHAAGLRGSLTDSVFGALHLPLLKLVLLRTVAWLAPISAAEYAWLTLHRIGQREAAAAARAPDTLASS